MSFGIYLLRAAWFWTLEHRVDRLKAGDRLMQRMENVLIDCNAPGV
jgi:hypothetical protein